MDDICDLVNETFASMSVSAVYDALILDMLDSRMAELRSGAEFPGAATSNMLDLVCDLAGFGYTARMYASDWLENVASDLVLDSM